MAPTPKVDSGDIYEFPYMAPERLSRWEALQRDIWNPKTHAFFGRTAKSWCGIFTFYILFYAGLAAVFSICMYGLMSTLSNEYPKWQLDESLIGSNPGLGFRPYSENVERAGSLIWYYAANETNTKQWTSVLDDFLRDYIDAKKPEKHSMNRMVCDYGQQVPPGKVCMVDIDDFGPCTTSKGYSYNHSTPCIFIKLNRIYNWVPEYFNDTADLPDDMPEDLKNYIGKLEPSQRNTIWVSCYGENPADRENIGEIRYIPKRGFPGYYYPYTNIPGYLSPIVAVHFERPALHTLINIECRAYAKNIDYKRALQHREGSVHFELMID